MYIHVLYFSAYIQCTYMYNVFCFIELFEYLLKIKLIENQIC